MNERDLLEAIGMLSDEAIEKTVLSDAVSSAEASGVPEIEMIMTKPPVSKKQKQTEPVAAKPAQIRQKKRMHIPAAAVVAACLILNAGVFLGIYKMNNTAKPAMSSVPVSVMEPEEAAEPYAEVLADTVSPIGCTLLLHNPTDETITYGERFTLFNDKGEEINSQTFSAERFEIKPGGTGKLNCWYATYASLLEETDLIKSYHLLYGLNYGEHMRPLDPGKYEIEVGFITSSEYIQYRRTDLIIPEGFEGKRPLVCVGSGYADVPCMIRALLSCGITNYEIIAQPTQGDQYESAGTIQKTEPHSSPMNSVDLNPGTMLYETNPGDIEWIGEDETVRIYVCTGSHDPDTVALPVMNGMHEAWAYKLLEQYLVTAGLHIDIQYEELPVNPEAEGEYANMMLGFVSKCDPQSTDSHPAKLRRGDTVTVYVYGSEEQLGYQKAYAEQAITWALEQALAEMDREQAGGTVQLPDLTGMDYEEARAAVLKLGLYAEKHSINDPDIPAGKVAYTVPECPAEVEASTCIKIIISQYNADSVALPDFRGKSMQEAKELAEENGIRISFTMRDNNAPYGTVIEQQAAPGVIMERSSTLEVYVSNGNG